jgi:cell division protein FtsL
MSTATLSFKRNQDYNKNNEHNIVLGPLTHLLFIGLILTLMSLLYLSGLNHSNKLSYQRNLYEEKLSSLQNNVARLEIETAKLTSNDRVKEFATNNNMVDYGASTILK